jgi:hypothetical protein
MVVVLVEMGGREFGQVSVLELEVENLCLLAVWLVGLTLLL